MLSSLTLNSPKVHEWLNRAQKNYIFFMNDVQPTLQVMLNAFPTWEVESKGCQDAVLAKCIDCVKKLPFVAQELLAINEAKELSTRKVSEQEKLQTEKNNRETAKEVLKFELDLIRSGRSRYEAATEAIEKERDLHLSQCKELVKLEISHMQSFHCIYKPTVAVDGAPISEQQALQGKGLMIEAERAFKHSLTHIGQEWKVGREDVHCIFWVDNAARLGNPLSLLSDIGSFVRANMDATDLLVYEEPISSKADMRLDFYQTRSMHSIFGEPTDAGLQPFKMQKLTVVREQTGAGQNKPVSTYIVAQQTSGVKKDAKRYELEVKDEGLFDLACLRKSALFNAPELNEVWDTREEPAPSHLCKYGWLPNQDRFAARGVAYEQFLLEALTENVRSSSTTKVAFVFDMLAMQGERMMAAAQCQSRPLPNGPSRC